MLLTPLLHLIHIALVVAMIPPYDLNDPTQRDWASDTDEVCDGPNPNSQDSDEPYDPSFGQSAL